MRVLEFARSSVTFRIDLDKKPPNMSKRLPAIRKKSIGFVFQQFNLFPALSAPARPQRV